MGFNVFITCLTRCLIASPLNGAVTVETRNKRPPENEMIKQVTLAKQTQPRNLWGVGRVGSSSPTHGWKAWTRLGTNVPVPELGQIQGGAPCWTVWHLACPFLRLPYLPGSPPGWRRLVCPPVPRGRARASSSAVTPVCPAGPPRLSRVSCPCSRGSVRVRRPTPASAWPMCPSVTGASTSVEPPIS